MWPYNEMYLDTILKAHKNINNVTKATGYRNGFSLNEQETMAQSICLMISNQYFITRDDITK